MTPLFFSRLVLKPSLHDLYDLHEAVWSGFGTDAARPFLFRADRVLLDDRSRAWKILVQSSRPADWSSLGERLVEQTQTGARQLAFSEGDRLRFFLRANATVSRKGKMNMGDLDEHAFRAMRGVRVGIRGEDRERAWLERHAAVSGFRVEAVRIVGHRRETWRQADRHAVYDGVDYEGHLLVNDVPRFEAAVTAGLGRGRAFGFGLLSLARDRI